MDALKEHFDQEVLTLSLDSLAAGFQKIFPTEPPEKLAELARLTHTAMLSSDENADAASTAMSAYVMTFQDVIALGDDHDAHVALEERMGEVVIETGKAVAVYCGRNFVAMSKDIFERPGITAEHKAESLERLKGLEAIIVDTTLPMDQRAQAAEDIQQLYLEASAKWTN